MTVRSSIFLIVMLLVSASPSVADGKYDASYKPEDYVEAIKDGALQRALEMISEEVQKRIAEKISDPKAREKLIRRLSKRALEELDERLNPEDSDEEMAEKMVKAINDSLLKYESSPHGALDLVLKYSVDYLTMKLEWQRKTEILECDEWMVRTECDIGSDGFQTCNTVGSYEKVAYTVEPDYRIFRVIDGKRKHVTTVEGGIRASNAKYSITTDPKDWGKQLWEYLRNSNDSSKLDLGVNFDYDTDVREPNTSLSYRIEASSNRFWNDSSFCESPTNWASRVDADSNADGRIDFVPKQAYLSDGIGGLLPSLYLLSM